MQMFAYAAIAVWASNGIYTHIYSSINTHNIYICVFYVNIYSSLIDFFNKQFSDK